MSIYEKVFRVGIDDIWINKKIKNQAIIRIFQDIAGMESELLHFGINDIERTRVSWIVLNWKIEVIKRPNYNEEIIVKTWVREKNRIFMFRDFEMSDKDGNILAMGTSEWAFINVDSKKLVDLPEDAVNAYENVDKSMFKDGKIRKISEPLNYSNVIDYKILRSDIDINNHIHNVNYINIAYESMPDEIYNKEEYNNLEIIYKQQIKYDDKIKVFYANESNKCIITIKSTDEKIIHSIIKLY